MPPLGVHTSMAREESDREDLIREATALVRRAEWKPVSGTETVVTGFRSDGSLSLYFGAELVYHFDPAGGLKRAYRAGRLYRTQGATLAELTRERTETETRLVRRDLEPSELGDFLGEVVERIEEFRKDIDERRIRISRIIPNNDTEFKSDLTTAFQKILMLAATKPLAPRYRGKR